MYVPRGTFGVYMYLVALGERLFFPHTFRARHATILEDLAR